MGSVPLTPGACCHRNKTCQDAHCESSCEQILLPEFAIQLALKENRFSGVLPGNCHPMSGYFGSGTTQNFPDPGTELLDREWLLDEINARIKNAMMSDGIGGIADMNTVYSRAVR